MSFRPEIMVLWFNWRVAEDGDSADGVVNF